MERSHSIPFLIIQYNFILGAQASTVARNTSLDLCFNFSLQLVNVRNPTARTGFVASARPVFATSHLASTPEQLVHGTTNPVIPSVQRLNGIKVGWCLDVEYIHYLYSVIDSSAMAKITVAFFVLFLGQIAIALPSPQYGANEILRPVFEDLGGAVNGLGKSKIVS